MIQGPRRFGLTIVLVLASSPAWAQPEPGRKPISQVVEGEKLIRLGEEAYSLRRWEEAERVFRSAIALREKALGPWHLTLAADLNKFASVVAARGKMEEAESLYRRVLAIREKGLGVDHPGVATSCTDLALFLVWRDEIEESVPLLLRALAIRRKSLGPQHPDTAKSLYLLATFALMIDAPEPAGAAGKQVDQSERYLKQALAIQEKALGTEHLDVADTLAALANIASRRRRWDDAESLLKRVLAIREKRLRSDDPGLATTIEEYASHLKANHHDQRTQKDVEKLLARARSIRAKRPL